MNGDPELLRRIFDLLLQVWDQERMPEECEIGIICPIFRREVVENVVITEELPCWISHIKFLYA